MFYWNGSLLFCILSFYLKPFLKKFRDLISILSLIWVLFSPTLLISMFVIAVVKKFIVKHHLSRSKSTINAMEKHAFIAAKVMI